MMFGTSRPATAAIALLLTAPLLLNACGRNDDSPDGAPLGMPAAFSPAQQAVEADGRIARCNTVHSLTLPARIVDRLNLAVGPETAVISCSLQMTRDGVTVNLPAEVFGTATALSGNIAKIDFKEVVEEETISYVGMFSIAARAGVRFDVTVIDPQTMKRYEVDFEQTEV